MADSDDESPTDTPPTDTPAPAESIAARHAIAVSKAERFARALVRLLMVQHRFLLFLLAAIVYGFARMVIDVILLAVSTFQYDPSLAIPLTTLGVVTVGYYLLRLQLPPLVAADELWEAHISGIDYVVELTGLQPLVQSMAALFLRSPPTAEVMTSTASPNVPQ